MRNWIFAAAALLAVAAPGVAGAQTGYVGIGYNNTEFDTGIVSDDEDAWGVEGAVAFAGSGSISFEIDAAIVDGDDDTGSALTGHVFHRNDSHLFGGFVGVADSSDTTTWTAGLEANKYFASWTLAGALIYANNDDVDTDGWGVNVEARAFATDNFRLQANVAWASIDAGIAGDDDVMAFGVGGEFQFDEMPISIGASYSHAEADTANVESDTVAVAVRWNWGGTLRDRDRNGASQASLTGVSFIL